MELIKTSCYAELSARIADMISAQLILKPRCTLGLATGSTPIGAYAELARRYQAGAVSFARAVSINLDEYAGMTAETPQSYAYFMNEHLFRHVDFEPENTHLPSGSASSLEEECIRYDRLIETCGGIDLQLLGMGHNGHIGFNEPGDFFIAETHAVKLSESTRSANARFFGGDMEKVPTHAVTMGIRSIMQAKQIVLAVNGQDKMETLKKALYGPITPRIPASILQLHRNLTVVFCEAE